MHSKRLFFLIDQSIFGAKIQTLKITRLEEQFVRKPNTEKRKAQLDTALIKFQFQIDKYLNNFGAKIQILEDDTIRRDVRAWLLVTKDGESSRADAANTRARFLLE